MRYFGNRQVPENPVIPDTTLSLLLTAASGQAFDYPAGCDIFRITGSSTLSGVGGPVILNPSSTAAAVPTTAGAISSTVGGQNILINPGEKPRIYQRPRGST